jgi:hypothetical protein
MVAPGEDTGPVAREDKLVNANVLDYRRAATFVVNEILEKVEKNCTSENPNDLTGVRRDLRIP